MPGLGIVVSMTDEIAGGIRYLASEFSATRQEFRCAHYPDGDALLDGLMSHGYVVETDGRYAASRAGLRRLADAGPAMGSV